MVGRLSDCCRTRGSSTLDLLTSSGRALNLLFLRYNMRVLLLRGRNPLRKVSPIPTPIAEVQLLSLVGTTHACVNLRYLNVLILAAITGAIVLRTARRDEMA